MLLNCISTEVKLLPDQANSTVGTYADLVKAV